MKFLLSLLITLVSMSATAQDMQKYLKETQEMVKQKNYKEANEHFIWFQDHSLEYERAMVGVRSSFALAYWKSLADIYPPAMDSMKAMRDTKTKLLMANNNASIDLFSDVVALNRTFDEEQKTIDIFEIIDKADHAKAKSHWLYAKDALFKAKRYDILQKFIGNPINEFEMIKSQRNLLSKYNKETDDRLKIFRDDDFVEKCLRLIKFSIAVDNPKEALEIKNEALKIVTDNRLRDVKMAKGND